MFELETLGMSGAEEIIFQQHLVLYFILNFVSIVQILNAPLVE